MDRRRLSSLSYPHLQGRTALVPLREVRSAETVWVKHAEGLKDATRGAPGLAINKKLLLVVKKTH